MTWMWATLLVAGLALLTYTAARVLRGGLVDGADGTSERSPLPARSPGASSAGASRARQILDERYASGELSTDEYEHRRAVLAGREDES